MLIAVTFLGTVLNLEQEKTCECKRLKLIFCNVHTVHLYYLLFVPTNACVYIYILQSLSPLALQPVVGFGLSNNILPFFLSVTNSLHLLTPST
jgi:hypothetical protein